MLAKRAAVQRRGLLRAIVLTAVVVAVVAGSRPAGPAIARLIACTPDPLAAACTVLGADVQLAVVSGWAEVEAGGPREAEDEYCCARAAMVALAGEQAARQAVQVAGVRKGAAELTASHGGVAYRTSCRRVVEGDAGKVYLTCELTVERAESAWLRTGRRRVEAALHSLGPGARRPEPVMITVSGLLDGVVTASKARAYACAVADRLHGSLVDVIDGEGYSAALAYAAVLGDAVSVGGRPVNLGLFFRPDPENGRTKVFLGTPLYTGDY